jgi:hypothetical protein
MSKYVETAMPDNSVVLDGSWKEDPAIPVREEDLKNRKRSIEEIKRKYKWTDEQAAEWVDDAYYNFNRADGLRVYLKQRPDGTWAWMVHMKFTSEQQRFYDYICTM